MNAAIRLDGLEKTYGDGKQALKGVDLVIPEGSLFALLGPNGAGKSTLINILAGLVMKTGGRANIWGFDLDEHPRNAKASIGVVPQELLFDSFFTPLETLELQAGLYGIPVNKRRSMELLRKVRLDDKAHAYTRTLSGGMKRRLLIAKAMVHRPPVVILDEPTAGVDIELRQMLWAYVRELHAEGVTVVLTTHYLEEVEELCDRIAILSNGQIVADDSKEDLLARSRGKELRITLDRDIALLPSIPGATEVRRQDGRHIDVHYDRRHTGAGAIIAALQAGGYGVVDLATREAELEDIFLQLTGEQPQPVEEV